MARVDAIWGTITFHDGAHSGSGDPLYLGVVYPVPAGGGQEWNIATKERQRYEPGETHWFLVKADPPNPDWDYDTYGNPVLHGEFRQFFDVNDEPMIYLRKHAGSDAGSDNALRIAAAEVRIEHGNPNPSSTVYTLEHPTWLGFEFGLQVWLTRSP